MAQDGRALQYASYALRRSDREVVLAAVEKEGYALRYASDELRNDREVVLAAVAQDAYALKYASGALRADRDIALAAVSARHFLHEPVLAMVAPPLRADRGVVLAAASLRLRKAIPMGSSGPIRVSASAFLVQIRRI